MKKTILMLSVILFFIGCSEKEPTPKAPTKDRVEIRTSSAEPTISAEFIPEHIRRSRIEVVKHY
ncbi:MAG: Unknown protein [uncultured Sulfurovum sp.]|uniref:Uncharacterized protein n=1 Tax=uncultured Sulfurovum sp. TaxID=269237 RepID=A0A6S6TK85_9BACT|nr:MAG: Unknown protein [uncultured Sulfurovum sp.]